MKIELDSKTMLIMLFAVVILINTASLIINIVWKNPVWVFLNSLCILFVVKVIINIYFYE